MLRVLGSPKRLCDGLTRRDALHVGGLSLLGLSLATPVTGSAPATQARGFGRAKRCILVYLYGGPSQLETFDPKPDAPMGVRGELKSIRSSLPGADVGELLPRIARVMDKVTVVRSVTHPYPIHGVAYATTGVPVTDVPLELGPHDGRHWPFIGSVVSHLEQRRDLAALRKPVPDNVMLPWAFSTRRTGEVRRAGPYAAFLGSAYHPHAAEFRGTATATITKMLREEYVSFSEPYVGIDPDCSFSLGEATAPLPDVTIDRLDKRRSLLAQFDAARRDLDGSAAVRALDRQRQAALALIGTAKVRDALNIQRESPHVRAMYGMTVFGQACLAARRLVEAGSKFVSVFWDEFGLAGSAWDTHWEHYPRMRNELTPGFDAGFSGLLSDLDQRGILDETLVLCLSEHGRTPQLSPAKGGGRDHWSRAYSVVLAGGGIKRGHVLGKTDKVAGDVTDSPVSPKDILATAYHLLGYDLETHLTDRAGRPQTLMPGGRVLTEALA